MNVLITGAAGFLGSHLVDAYLDRGDCVQGLDDLTTSTGENLEHLNDRPEFSFARYDVCETLPVTASFDLILHFASAASPTAYSARPIHTLLTNAQGLRNCCELGRLMEARVVFASTSEIYGDPLEHPQTESYWGNVNSLGERSCYDEAKRFGEALAMAYVREAGLDVRIVRIFNTYGPRMRPGDGRVVPTFIAQALSGQALTVFGEGLQTRSLCYVDDLVRGVVEFAA
ncbi:MAG: NAD-dependent epimerase/dehydratase family protein, partial [Burkholderiales bacterium]